MPLKFLNGTMEKLKLDRQRPVGIAVVGTGAWSGAVGPGMLKSAKVKLVTGFDNPGKRTL